MHYELWGRLNRTGDEVYCLAAASAGDFDEMQEGLGVICDTMIYFVHISIT